MKYPKIIPFLFALIWISSVKAQDFGATLIAGTTFSQVDGDRFGGYNKMGLTGGVEVNRAINEQWTGAFQILYIDKGSRRKITEEDLLREIFILKFSYLEMPLLATYRTGDISFFFGPSIGILLNAKRDTGLGFIEIDDINKMEIATRLGAAYHFNDLWSFNLTHSSSLFRIGNPYQGGIYILTRNGLYNRLFNVGFSYSLFEKK
jgi:hypothetical protein